mgnify:CR=1 FL=1
MHKLEYAIFAISILLEKSTENREDLAKELLAIASASHNYKEPERKELDLIQSWISDLHKRVDGFIYGEE